jgi:glucose-fructose oxidoreductase
LDYLGYGTTIGTWYHDGRKPLEITTTVDQKPGLEVDEHSVTVVRYATGLSTLETRWGTFTDPWIHQPQPKCGFVLQGDEGTISTYDYEKTVRVQTRAKPAGFAVAVDKLKPPFQDPIQYFVHCINKGLQIEGPLSPALSRIGQQIVDSAVRSARLKRTVDFIE